MLLTNIARWFGRNAEALFCTGGGLVICWGIWSALVWLTNQPKSSEYGREIRPVAVECHLGDAQVVKFTALDHRVHESELKLWVRGNYYSESSGEATMKFYPASTCVVDQLPSRYYWKATRETTDSPIRQETP